MYSIVSECLKTNIAQTLRENNSKTLRIKNAKFSGYCFYMNTNKYWDFQIYISVLLKLSVWFLKVIMAKNGLHLENFRDL